MLTTKNVYYTITLLTINYKLRNEEFLDRELKLLQVTGHEYCQQQGEGGKAAKGGAAVFPE